MCGRFAQVIEEKEIRALKRELDAEIGNIQTEISFNVAPTNTVMAIVSQNGRRYDGYFRWGLVPSWMKEIPQSPMINVRAETIAEKPSFKASFRRRRGVLPINGFYEWRAPEKTPFYIYPKEGELLYVAAIYDVWEDDQGSYLPTLGLITTEANSQMKEIHHRMPVLLMPEDFDRWLDDKNEDTRLVLPLLKPAKDGLINMHEVSREVNRVASNHPGLILPI